MATFLNQKNVIGWSILHEEGLHSEGPSTSWFYDHVVVHANRHYSSSWYFKENI